MRYSRPSTLHEKRHTAWYAVKDRVVNKLYNSWGEVILTAKLSRRRQQGAVSFFCSCFVRLLPSPPTRKSGFLHFAAARKNTTLDGWCFSWLGRSDFVLWTKLPRSPTLRFFIPFVSRSSREHPLIRAFSFSAQARKNTTLISVLFFLAGAK